MSEHKKDEKIIVKETKCDISDDRKELDASLADTEEHETAAIPTETEGTENNTEVLTIKPEAENKKRAKLMKDIVDYIELFVIAIGFVLLLFSFCCRLCSVSGPSMNNTLQNGEKVIISDLFYTPKRGDIIVFHDTNTLNEPVIKRVIATEGERVAITYYGKYMKVSVTDKDGKVTLLEEDYIVYEGPTYAPATYYVPEGTVFVMGDNRSHSMDSRHPDIGFVDERSILGRVLLRITPIKKFGTVK